jgi:CBS domain-containing protein
MRPVTRAIRESPPPLAHDATVIEAAHRVEGISLESWPVTDEDGLVGMVRTQAIQEAAAKGSNATIAQLIADEIADRHPVHVHTDHPLSVALARMGESGHDVLPVVSRANGRVLVGLVTLKDVLKAYGVS